MHLKQKVSTMHRFNWFVAKGVHCLYIYSNEINFCVFFLFISYGKIIIYFFFTKWRKQLLDMIVRFLNFYKAFSTSTHLCLRKSMKFYLFNGEKKDKKKRKKTKENSPWLEPNEPSNTFSNLIFKSQQRHTTNKTGKNVSSRIIHYLVFSLLIYNSLFERV